MSFKLWDELHNKTNPRIQWPQGAETFGVLLPRREPAQIEVPPATKSVNRA